MFNLHLLVLVILKCIYATNNYFNTQMHIISDTLTLSLSSIILLGGKCDFWVLFTNTVDDMVFPSLTCTSVLQQ